MLEADLALIFAALNQAQARYLVVGGLAVIAYGYARGTADLELVVALDEANATRTIQALESLGYVPLASVPAASFAFEKIRRTWVEEKGMQVFQLRSDRHPGTSIDLFVTSPLDFETEYARAPRMELVEGQRSPIVPYEALVAMKRKAGRSRDLEDLDNLGLIREGPAVEEADF